MVIEKWTSSTVSLDQLLDGFSNEKEMWIAIERLQQGDSINIQDVKTMLFWEFDKFTSRDRESIESYYTRFYTMMNEIVRNKLIVDTMQFRNQKTVTVAGNREQVGTQIVEQSGI
nr:hypothetical protein [Tanacetum cinerariifolium]